MSSIIKSYNKYREVVNYLIFGVLTTFVSLVSYYLLTNSLLSPNERLELQIANVISWIISVLFAYVTNRKYVFNSKNDNTLKEISSFLGSRIITLVIDMVLMFIGVTLLSFNHRLLKLISQVLVVIGNYILSKLFVF